MAVTKPIIRFGIFDTTARDDAEFSATGKSAYSSTDILKLVAYESIGYATLELNNWLLNGTQPLPPTDIATGKWGVMSGELSNATGVLATPLVVSVAFDNPHTSAGITLCGDVESYPPLTREKMRKNSLLRPSDWPPYPGGYCCCSR